MTDRSALDSAVLSASLPTYRSLTEIDAHTRNRRLRSRALRGLLTASMVIAIIPLVMIVSQVFINGFGTLSWEFLTQVEFPPRREGGGYLQGIVGTG